MLIIWIGATINRNYNQNKSFEATKFFYFFLFITFEIYSVCKIVETFIISLRHDAEIDEWENKHRNWRVYTEQCNVAKGANTLETGKPILVLDFVVIFIFFFIYLFSLVSIEFTKKHWTTISFAHS